jgi:hypothetical protein
VRKVAGSLILELEPTVGDNDSIVARPLLLLGLAYENQGKYVDAETALSRCLTIFKASLGDDHPRDRVGDAEPRADVHRSQQVR